MSSYLLLVYGSIQTKKGSFFKSIFLFFFFCVCVCALFVSLFFFVCVCVFGVNNNPPPKKRAKMRRDFHCAPHCVYDDDDA